MNTKETPYETLMRQSRETKSTILARLYREAAYKVGYNEVKGFDEYGHYGENNPPLRMSNPSDRDYEC